MLYYNESYSKALKDIEKGSFVPYSHLKPVIGRVPAVRQVGTGGLNSDQSPDELFIAE
jgi:hypothetical protein